MLASQKGSIQGNSLRKDGSSTFDAHEEASSWGAEVLTGQVKEAALDFLGMRPKSGRTKEHYALVLQQHSTEHEPVCLSQYYVLRAPLAV